MKPGPTVKGDGRHPRPRESSLWKQAKGYGAGSKPSRRDYAAGSWVAWTDHHGTRRTGIVTTDPFTVTTVKRTAEVGTAKEGRTRAAVVPSDGGEMLPLCLPNANNPQALVKDQGRWLRILPAHSQPIKEMAAA